jgi:hypothetical protein
VKSILEAVGLANAREVQDAGGSGGRADHLLDGPLLVSSDPKRKLSFGDAELVRLDRAEVPPEQRRDPHAVAVPADPEESEHGDAASYPDRRNFDARRLQMSSRHFNSAIELCLPEPATMAAAARGCESDAFDEVWLTADGRQPQIRGYCDRGGGPQPQLPRPRASEACRQVCSFGKRA